MLRTYVRFLSVFVLAVGAFPIDGRAQETRPCEIDPNSDSCATCLSQLQNNPEIKTSICGGASRDNGASDLDSGSTADGGPQTLKEAIPMVINDTDCQTWRIDYRAAKDAARAEENGETVSSIDADPNFRLVYDTCMRPELNIFGQGVEINAAGRPVLSIPKRVDDLNSKIPEGIPADEDFTCSTKNPNVGGAESLENIRTDFNDLKADIQTFQECGQWYERIAQCFLKVDMRNLPTGFEEGSEEVKTLSKNALRVVAFRHWTNNVWPELQTGITERLNKAEYDSGEYDSMRDILQCD